MFEGERWYEYLDEPMKEMMNLGYLLLDREEMVGEELTDYSFVVFPVAKAYEGFLKKLMFDFGLIDKENLMGKVFRVGRSLNPTLPESYRDDMWIYDRLVRLCEAKSGDVRLAEKLWNAWRLGRNELFHYFVGEVKMVDLAEARSRVDAINEVMKLAIDSSGAIRKVDK